MIKLLQIGGQVKSELDDFISLLNVIEPESYLEIGAREGHAMRYLVERIPSIERVRVIDMPGAQWGKDNSQIILATNLTSLNADVTVHLGNSRDSEIIEEVQRQRYDIIFIDADHSYEGVKADLENYGPLANKIVALHDINHPPESRAYGPTRLWNEIKDNYDTKEFIAEGSKKGIGVILK